MTVPDQPLAGCLMIITADRRAQELAAALERRGAEVQQAPALSTISHLDDHKLMADTKALIASPPHVVVVTTGIGFRSWLQAADAAGLSAALRDCLRGARLIARGPKALGAIKAAGLEATWVAQGETAAEMRDYLLNEGVTGLRIAVQHHGTGSDGMDEAFTHAGAQVQSLLVYGSGPPTDPQAHRAGIERAATGAADAVLFTSAPAAQAWLTTAVELEAADAVAQRSVDGTLVIAAVGPVTAHPLQQAGMVVRYPDRWRLGAMIRDLSAHYAEHTEATQTVDGSLVMRATKALLDGRALPLSSTGLGLLRALVHAAGAVVAYEALAELVAPAQTTSEIDAEIARLCDSAGSAHLVRLVDHCGYALAVAQ